MGRFDEVYRRSLEDPEGFWAEAAAAIDWDRALGAGARRLARAVLPLVRRRPAQHLLQRARPPRRGGPRRPARADLRHPGHRARSRRFTYRELRDAVARFAGALAALGVERGDRVIDLHADGPRGGDRDARLRAPRRGPLGRVRRLRRERARDPDRRRAAEGRRLGVVRHRAGPARRLQAAARRRDRAASRRSRERCIILQRPMLEAELDPGRDLDWDEARRRAPSRPTACRSRRPIRSTSSTPRARPASRRGSSATTAATPSRSPGR